MSSPYSEILIYTILNTKLCPLPVLPPGQILSLGPLKYYNISRINLINYVSLLEKIIITLTFSVANCLRTL